MKKTKQKRIQMETMRLPSLITLEGFSQIDQTKIGMILQQIMTTVSRRRQVVATRGNYGELVESEGAKKRENEDGKQKHKGNS